MKRSGKEIYEKIYVIVLNSWKDKIIDLKEFNEDQKLEAFELALKLDKKFKNSIELSVDVFIKEY